MICTERSGTRNTDQPIRYPFHYGPWHSRFLKLVPGALCRSSVDLGPDTVRVSACLGDIVIPRESIVRVWHVNTPRTKPVERLHRVLGLPNEPDGALWVNGSRANLVSIEMDPPTEVYRWRRAIKVWSVIVSVDDPEALIGALLG